MPYTPNYAAGDILTAAAMNSIGEAWTSFTPTWTAATTNPIIGNGILTGAYCQINKVVVARYKIVAGSTTTYGAGDYYVSLPVAANSAYVARDAVGSGILYNYTVDDYVVTVGFESTSRLLFWMPKAVYTAISTADNIVAQFWSPTTPFTFGTSDEMHFSITYQAA